ncbi:GNAT family N-acetyltransferase [Thauera sp.]|jgi:hypothetical protein|uniref:GNAT family N-acetyltransferase n=1 Tax=Thauera sp. TaxID=1905334 RepID=UPI002A36B9EC|nr:GNAT family N-acetyltransferase [Thauera sp.]MDX9885106.1 GNAT family N-acetyltransferase [Thauera sp.]
MPYQRIVANISQLGWVDGLFFLTARTLSKLTGRRARIIRYHIMAQPVQCGAYPTRPSNKTTIGLIDHGDPFTEQFPRAPEVVAQRYRSGSRCLAAKSGDRFAGFIWLARGGYDEDMVRCRYEFAYPAESAWDFDVFVDPDFRVGRTFVRLWDATNEQLRSEGVRWCFSRIESSNPGSLHAHRRLGIRKLFSVTFVCLGPVQLTFAGAAPYVHVSLSQRSRPTLRLSPPRQHGSA